MTMSKFTNSNEAISSSLMLWQTKPTQVSVKESYDTKVWPISNIFNEGPITFSIPEQPHGMMKNIEIVTKFKIQKDGKDFSVEQDNLSIINNFANSLWQIVDVTINIHLKMCSGKCKFQCFISQLVKLQLT